MTSSLLIMDKVAALADELGPRAIMSLRVLAAVVLVTMLCGLIHVLRNIRSMRAEPGPRGENATASVNHIMIFVGCAVVFAAACALLYLVAKSGSPI
jgi:hypothetical protein